MSTSSEYPEVRILSHTHWDREWYLPSRYTREWLTPFFESLLERLEEHSQFRFMLDGQTILLEDYLEVGGPRAQSLVSGLRKYIENGQLLAGPYYLQPDWNLAGGEVLIRNLLIGTRDARKLGACMSCGWLPDNFGQAAQTVQIHREFGLSGLFVWRGIELSPEQIRTELIWESPDGSRFPTIYMVDSYRNGMQLLAEPDLTGRRIAWAAERLSPFSLVGTALLLNGYDQEVEPEPVNGIETSSSEHPDVRQTTAPEYIAEISRRLRRLHIDPPIISGSQYSGRYISVFPGVLSARMYLKTANAHVETLLARYVEPLAVAAWLAGESYPRDELESLWRMVLQNHPHDSMCGVSVDSVHVDMELRFSQIEHRALELAEKCLEALCSNEHKRNNGRNNEDRGAGLSDSFLATSRAEEKTPGEDRGATDGAPVDKFLWNPSPWLRTEVVDANQGTGQRVIECEPLSLTGIPLGNTQEDNGRDELNVDTEAYTVSGPYYIATVESDGTLSFEDRETGRRWTGIGELIDEGDAGDTYNYSPPESDTVVRSTAPGRARDNGLPGFGPPEDNASTSGKTGETHNEAGGRNRRRWFIRTGRHAATIGVSLELAVPSRLEDDRSGRSDELTNIPVEIMYAFQADSRRIEITVSVDNQADDHRLRIVFPTRIDTDLSFAETQFYVDSHPITEHNESTTPLPDYVARVVLGAHEVGPIRQFPQARYCFLRDKSAGFAVFNRGLPEYEVLPSQRSIAVTLVRAVGWLARSDLRSRTGDAGPKIFTPDAQCRRTMTFSLAFCAGSLGEQELSRQAEEFCNPVWQVAVDRQGQTSNGGQTSGQGQTSNGNGPAMAAPGIALETRGLGFSAVKKSEDRDTVIVRVWNGSRETKQTAMRVAGSVRKARLLSASERDEEAIGNELSPVELSVVPVGTEAETSTSGRARTGDEVGPPSVAGKWQRNATSRIPFTLSPWKIATIELEMAVSEPTEDVDGERAWPVPTVEVQRRTNAVPSGREQGERSCPLSEEHVEGERVRMQQLEADYGASARKLEASANGDGARHDDPHRRQEFIRLRARTSTLLRASLEARLSWVLNREKLRQWRAGIALPQAESPEATEELREIGRRLRRVRVEKRMDDYVLALERERYEENRFEGESDDEIE